MARTTAAPTAVSGIGRAPRFKLTTPIVREPVLHKQIADALRLELAPAGRISHDGVVWWSVDMAAYAGSVPGIRTGRGCIAGVPDIIVLYRGRAFFLEVKADDGSVSPAQRQLCLPILLVSCGYAVARNAGEALDAIDEWKIPRAHRLRGS